MTMLDRFITQRELPAPAGLPPGPSRMPAVVQTLLFLTQGTYTADRWQRRYGDVFCAHIAPAGRAVVLSRPEHIREVFAGAADTFHAGEGNAILGPVMGEHSVLLLDEDAHRASRKRVMSAFRGEAISSWAEVLDELAAENVASWPVGAPFAVHSHMNDISLEVILRIVFGLTDGERLAEMRPLLKKLVQTGPTIFLGWLYPQLERVGPWRRFRLLKDKVDTLIYAEIADRRLVTDLAERTDVLSRLLVADPMQSDEELRDHLITLLLAGHETTASTLAWTFHDLARNPQPAIAGPRATRGRRERRGLPGGDGQGGHAAATGDPQRGAAAHEARTRGRVRPAGRRRGLSLDPSGAAPRRRLRRRDAVSSRTLPQRQSAACDVDPFGGGLRRCLGASLAMVEAQAVLKAVLQRVDIAPDGPAERSKIRNITTVPARGAQIVSLPR